MIDAGDSVSARNKASAGKAPPPAAVRYIRFVMITSTITTLLIVAPVITAALKNPKGQAFSPPIILWVAGVLAVAAAIVIWRARRLRAELSSR